MTDHVPTMDPTGGQSPEKTSTAQLRQFGEDCIIALARLLRSITQYDRTNVVFVNQAEESLVTMTNLIGVLGHISLKFVQDTCFLNSARINTSAVYFALTKYFLQEMRQRNIGEIEFTGKLTLAALITFIEVLARLEPHDDGNIYYVRQQLERAGIHNISVGKLEQLRDELNYSDSELKRRRSKDVYFKTLDLIKEAVEGIQQRRGLQARRVKRQMMKAVDLLMQDETALLGLANIKSYDDYTFNHSVNVAIYAIALGQRIGINRRELTYLGMAGLFHDIGKTGISLDVLNKQEALTEEEWALIESHPLLGVEMLLGFKQWGELSVRMITAAFEHHLKYDLTGYPKLSNKRMPSLFSRIITIADCYDALGRRRVFRPFPFVAEKVLSFLVERSGKDFDPVLVKVFVSMIGIFPLGSLVELSTGEMGIVIQTQLDADKIDRPEVCLLEQVGATYERGDIVNLTETDPKTGAFLRGIVRTLDPYAYGIDVGEFFL